MIFEARSHAKINLGLSIKGKRPDGYHNLETVFFPVFDLFDNIEIRESQDLKNHLSIENLAIEGNPDDNLCLRAWQLLKAEVVDLPFVSIKLVKNIPMGAGLGGGSSNAAFVLRGLLGMFSIDLDFNILKNIAQKLGADVPFFLQEKPKFASGIGTDFQDISCNMPGQLKIHAMPFHSNTVLAYKGLSESDFSLQQPVKEIVESENLERWRMELKNDFEPSVFKRFSELAIEKEKLYQTGASYVAMSGSGSAIFSIWE